jgi:hypothetical protein
MGVSEFLTSLSQVASSPYAFAAYIAVVAAWVYTTVARHRLSRMANLLRELPPAERTQLIAKEYSFAPRGGLSAEQWIRSRQHLLLFLGFFSLVVCATVIVIIALVRPPSEQILDLQRKFDILTARAAKLDAELASLQKAKPEPTLVALSKELSKKYDAGDTSSDWIFSDPSLSVEQKIMLSISSTREKLDRDVEEQARRVEQLQIASAERSSPSIDVETMKLKRLIDKRTQMVDVMRQIIDKYNETAKGIIDSIGR